jgi:hypothetical protein
MAEPTPLLQLKLRNVTPRNGYVYTDPDTGLELRGPMLQDLVNLVVRHRGVNNLPIAPNIAALVEDAVCRANPPSFSRPAPTPVRGPAASSASVDALAALPEASTPVTTSDCVRRTLVLLRRSPRRLSAEDAGPRHLVCRACAANVAEPTCYECFVESVFVPQVGRHKAPWNKFLGMCAIDRTFTKAVIRMKDTDAFAGINYPEPCWKITRTIEEPQA